MSVCLSVCVICYHVFCHCAQQGSQQRVRLYTGLILNAHRGTKTPPRMPFIQSRHTRNAITQYPGAFSRSNSYVTENIIDECRTFLVNGNPTTVVFRGHGISIAVLAGKPSYPTQQRHFCWLYAMDKRAMCLCMHALMLYTWSQQ